jgi:quercetin 2,3-dioxygenase
MIELRPFDTLGHADHGWLDARHHFSFGHYHDAKRMAWGNLRVWNDDTIAAGAGFPAHPHQEMEIITYVREGAISHQDSLGNAGRTVAGDVQVMSAGSGIRHAEFNQEDVTTRIFQIWIIPDRHGAKPSWGTRPFPKDDRSGRFVTLASGLPEDGDALKINAHARVAGAFVKAGTSVTYDTDATRHLYLVPASGSIRVNDTVAMTRDGIAITGESRVTITAVEDSEIVLVDAA